MQIQGFANLHDDDLVTTADLSHRLGFSHVSSFWRWLAKRGVAAPPTIRRGVYRGLHVKAWIDGLSSTEENCQTKTSESEKDHPETPTSYRKQAGAAMTNQKGASADVVSLDAARTRLRRKIDRLSA